MHMAQFFGDWIFIYEDFAIKFSPHIVIGPKLSGFQIRLTQNLELVLGPGKSGASGSQIPGKFSQSD